MQIYISLSWIQSMKYRITGAVYNSCTYIHNLKQAKYIALIVTNKSVL